MAEAIYVEMEYPTVLILNNDEVDVVFDALRCYEETLLGDKYDRYIVRDINSVKNALRNAS